MRDNIYRLLRESSTDGESFWSHADLLLLANMERDSLLMELNQAFEGFSVETRTTDLVADQSHYSLPTDASRIMRVSFVDTEGNETPLQRLERWEEQTPGMSGFGYAGLPTYRLTGEYIVLTPTPAAAHTDGLKMDFEVSLDFLADDGDRVIPLNFPLEVETFLMYAIAVAAFDQEGAMGPETEGLYQSYVRRKDMLLTQIKDVFETRTFSKVFNTGYVIYC